MKKMIAKCELQKWKRRRLNGTSSDSIFVFASFRANFQFTSERTNTVIHALCSSWRHSGATFSRYRTENQTFAKKYYSNFASDNKKLIWFVRRKPVGLCETCLQSMLRHGLIVRSACLERGMRRMKTNYYKGLKICPDRKIVVHCAILFVRFPLQIKWQKTARRLHFRSINFIETYRTSRTLSSHSGMGLEMTSLTATLKMIEKLRVNLKCMVYRVVGLSAGHRSVA